MLLISKPSWNTSSSVILPNSSPRVSTSFFFTFTYFLLPGNRLCVFEGQPGCCPRSPVSNMEVSVCLQEASHWTMCADLTLRWPWWYVLRPSLSQSTYPSTPRQFSKVPSRSSYRAEVGIAYAKIATGPLQVLLSSYLLSKETRLGIHLSNQ
jgi:hypothetical protein